MRGKVHRHVELAANEGDETMPVPHAHAVASIERANRISLLRLSVPARLLIVAIASVLLWGAVLWALV